MEIIKVTPFYARGVEHTLILSLQQVQLRLLSWSFSLRLSFHRRNVLALLFCILMSFLSIFCVRLIHDRRIALIVLLVPIAAVMLTCLEVTGDMERDQRRS